MNAHSNNWNNSMLARLKKLPRSFAAVVIVFALGPVATGAETSRPNIVFILADDMGPGDIACYGVKMVPTPHIDRLSEEGTKFTQFYVASPVCSPSRCALVTGQFPARWRITSYLDCA
jgi:hypothetical protein